LLTLYDRHERHSLPTRRSSDLLTWDDENYYMVAYEAASDAIRHYRVDKMEHIELTDLRREGQRLFHDQFNIASYARKVFGMFSGDRKSTRLNSSHVSISYALFC